jgi:ferredoxin-NADP reductase
VDSVTPDGPRRAPIRWHVATVRDARAESPTARAKTIVLDVPGWPGHIAGHHVDVRLTAEDGYQTERSYSIASAPEEPMVELTVERLEDGEVSPYLTEVLRVGDPLELRGPFTGYFVWRMEDGGPLLPVAGGSGLVPLMAMLRHRAARMTQSRRGCSCPSARSTTCSIATSSRGQTRHKVSACTTPSRASCRPDWGGFARRIDAEMLRAVGPSPVRWPRIFVCGPTAFVEQAVDLLAG